MLPKKYSFNEIAEILKTWILVNYKLKLIALLVTLMAWVYVAIVQNSKVDLNVPLKITISSDKDMVIIGDMDKNVMLTVWGTNDKVRTLGPDQIKLFLDIKNPQQGQNRFELNENNIFLPKRVKLLDINPRRITLDFKKYKEEKKP
jgi:YbbR domain-containing protein